MADNGTERISTRQARAIQAILTEPNLKAAAQSAKVGYRTIWRWAREDEAFMAALSEAESRALDELSTGLSALAGKALEVLDDILGDKNAGEHARLRASEIVLGNFLKLKELVDIENRLLALEQKANETKY